MSRTDRSARSHALRSSSGTQLLVLGIVLAVFALWVVPGLSKNSHGADANGTAGAGNSEEAGEFGGPPPTPEADPAADAYQAVEPGDCLVAPGSGLPERVDCAAEQAFLRVVSVSNDPGTCPSGPGLGDWYHTTHDGLTTALCLQREFRVGQCFAATLSTEQGQYAMTNADLRTPLDCMFGQVNEPYNITMVISEVLPFGPGSQECTQDPDRLSSYWFWVANEETVKVCATFPDTPGEV